ncbi:hypothetical protein PDE_01294 [Penicillium oxalicum 114-2]|uniref:Uncharacterized protein n=1 Tax=Penicillium oxalicum (strain 114-2 / CGMCC 5302) TaxID=933388 RepID=S8AKM9_PENO1|nr:hypothetical protein PDE_01294 [Penicillium oxalicum 114-2]
MAHTALCSHILNLPSAASINFSVRCRPYNGIPFSLPDYRSHTTSLQTVALQAFLNSETMVRPRIE